MEYKNGPNQVIPCENLTISLPNGHVKFRSTGHQFEKEFEAISVPGLLHKIASEYPNSIALIAKESNGNLKKYTYREYENHVRICAKAFLKLGLERYHAVGILGYNCPEWFISNIGAIYAGGITTGIYTTNSSEACYHVAYNSRANIIVVEDDYQLQKILQIKSRLPDLKAIIQYSGVPTRDDVLSWEQLMDLGEQQTDDQLEETLKTIAINECSTIVYTSGTAGNPKGVMLSHDNIIFNVYGIMKQVDLRMGHELIVSYLPLSHIAAQVVDIYLTMANASAIFFADKDALKGSLLNTLLAARPTRFLGVPRVWEKMHEKMQQVAEESGYVKRFIGNWAKSQGLQHYLNMIQGTPSHTWSYALANMLIFNKIKQALGLDNCLTFASSAAPLSSDIKKYFLSINIPIVEAYGMSEASGAHTMGTIDTLHLESVGRTILGVDTKLDNVDNDQNGEICMNGRHVFMGYLNDEEKNKNSIDEDGWLHSGDLGKIDDNQMIYITGRLKEILITAGGENIAPILIEQQIKAEMPYLSNAVVIGDKRKFLSVLLTLKTEIDLDTNIPTDILTKPVEKWIKSLGSEATTITKILEEGPHPKVLETIQEALNKVNSQAISNAQRIQKFAILPRDFAVMTGELGPTLKYRRNIITNKYKAIIDEFYK